MIISHATRRTVLYSIVSVTIMIAEECYAQNDFGGWGGFGKTLQNKIEEATKTIDCKSSVSDGSIRNRLDELWAEDLMYLYADACKKGEGGRNIDWKFGKMANKPFDIPNVLRTVPRCWAQNNKADFENRLEKIFQKNRDKQRYSRLNWYINFIDRHLDADQKCKDELRSLLRRSVGEAWRQANRPWVQDAIDQSLDKYDAAERYAYKTYGCPGDMGANLEYKGYTEQYETTIKSIVNENQLRSDLTVDSGFGRDVKTRGLPIHEEARSRAVQDWNSLDTEHRRALRAGNGPRRFLEDLASQRIRVMLDRDCI